MGRALEPLLTPDVTAHLPAALAFTRGQDPIDGWITRANSMAAVYTAALSANGTLAGLLLLHPSESPGRRDLTVGYLLGHAFWGRGLATELVSGLVETRDRQHPCTLFAGVDAANLASRRVLDKAGFERDEVETDAVRLAFVRRPRT